jgi:hypothetical protein
VEAPRLKVIVTLENENVVQRNDGTLSFISKMAVESDGSGDSHGDPDYQNDTSLHWNGEALNADIDKFIAVPPQIIRGVKPVVLGSQVYVLNLRNGRFSEAVVGDEGPPDKIGEGSCALASAMGLDPSPTDGGESDHVIFYAVKPGHPAVVDGKKYQLQPS